MRSSAVTALVISVWDISCALVEVLHLNLLGSFYPFSCPIFADAFKMAVLAIGLFLLFNIAADL